LKDDAVNVFLCLTAHRKAPHLTRSQHVEYLQVKLRTLNPECLFFLQTVFSAIMIAVHFII